MNLKVIGLLALVGASALQMPSGSAEGAENPKVHRHHAHEGHDHDHRPTKKKEATRTEKQVRKKLVFVRARSQSHFHPTLQSRDVGHPSHGLETEHLFGFTIGSDIGDVGHREILLDTMSRFGKRVGSYSATTSRVEAGFTPFANFHIAVGAAGSLHRISDVQDWMTAAGLLSRQFRLRRRRS
jgi:hypothetical protein